MEGRNGRKEWMIGAINRGVCRRWRTGGEESSEEEIEKKNLSLTVITLTLGVIYTTVFEYQNQVIFNMPVFDGRPSLSNSHLLLVSKQKRRFWNTKSKSYFNFNMTLFEGRVSVSD
jgi:hypothetical protein